MTFQFKTLNRGPSFVLSAGLFLALSGCDGAPPGAPAPQEGVTDVAIQNLAFDPRNVPIRRGETVRWTNRESAPIPHTTTSGTPGAEAAADLWNSDPPLNPGESFSQTFDEVGVFTYFCRIHSDDPNMVGATVTVEE